MQRIYQALNTGFVVMLLAVLVGACQTTSFSRPADPAYAPLAGTWESTSNWPATLTLLVGDGNRIAGEFHLTNPNNGNSYSGPVSGSVDGTTLSLTAAMYSLDDEYKLDLIWDGPVLSGQRTTKESTYGLNLRKG